MKGIVYRSKVAPGKQRMLFSLFCGGTTARAAATIAGVNRNTSTRIFRYFRAIIARNRAEIARFDGASEVDECYLSGGKGGRKAARQGRSLAGKFVLLGMAQRRKDGTRRVRIEPARRVNEATLSAFVKENAAPGSQINTDQLPAYKLDAAGFVHRRVNHSKEWRSRGGACTNQIESAWSVLRRHFGRFCGGWRHRLSEWVREVEMRIECGVKGFPAAFLAMVKEAARFPLQGNARRV